MVKTKNIIELEFYGELDEKVQEKLLKHLEKHTLEVLEILDARTRGVSATGKTREVEFEESDVEFLIF